MKVSVIICTYGMERMPYLVETVRSVLKQSYSNYEILIVSDNNEELLFQLHRNFDDLGDAVRILTSNEKGLSNARNIGIKHSTGEIIAFIDDDALADPEWLSNLIRNYKDSTVVGAGGIIKPIWVGNRPKWFPEELDWIVGCTYKGHPKGRCEVRNVIGCNMSFRKSIFEQIGLFENKIGRVGKKLLAGEETELCMRILDNKPGFKIIYDPDAIVYHKVPKNRQTLRYVLRRASSEGISKGYIRKMSKDKEREKVLSIEQGYLHYVTSQRLQSILGNDTTRRSLKIASGIAHTIILWIVVVVVITHYLLEVYLR